MKHRKVGIFIIIVGFFLTYACAHTGNTGTPAGTKSVELRVPRADTPTASTEVTYILKKVDGVINWRTSITTGTVRVTFDPKKVTIEEIYKALEDGEYKVFGSPKWLT